MNKEQIQEARKLCNDATVGPWRHRENGQGGYWIDCNAFANNGKGKALGGSLATVNDFGSGKAKPIDNAQFIAASRTLLPAALDEIEYLQKLYRLTLEKLNKFEHSDWDTSLRHQLKWLEDKKRDSDEVKMDG